MAPDRRLRVAVIFGGVSAEHAVSIRSAKTVLAALDRTRFEPWPIGIDPHGGWHALAEDAVGALQDRVAGNGPGGLAVLPGSGSLLRLDGSSPEPVAVDVAFPLVHGPGGEDGSLQGLLEAAAIPYVGPGVLASALGMDKTVQKRLLRDAGIPVVPWVELRREEWRKDPAAARAEASALGLPLFVKPAGLGSSVGVSCVERHEALDEAIEAAFRHDAVVLVECGVDAREIECAVLGNEEPQASLPGEIVPGERFYSYRDKYDAGSRARLLIPAPLGEDLAEHVRRLAVRVFRLLRCEGMTRVDFFLDRHSGTLFVNEVNTIPGFTSISMYPKLWEASGMPLPELVGRLIDLALERSRRRARGAGAQSSSGGS